VLRNTIGIFTIVLFFFSCTEGEKDTALAPVHEFIPVPAKGRTVRVDTIINPVIIPVETKKLQKISLGEPEYKSTGLEVYSASNPELIEAGVPKICTPGLDSLKKPIFTSSAGRKIKCGLPELMVAKDPYIKDQNPANFSTFTKLQGLQNNAVSCMLQDKSGNLWFGTLGGVSKYDGRTFWNFTEKEGLANKNVRAILEDRDGNIWFGTSGGGVSKYDGKFFTNYTSKDGLANNIVMSLLQDKAGNIWFGTDGGVSMYNGKGFTTYTDRQGLVNNIVWSIMEDSEENLWFGTYGGVSKYNGKTFANFTEKEGLPSNIVTSVSEDIHKNIWFGTFGGISRYDKRYFQNFTEKEGLPSNNIWSVKSDKMGNLWMGTTGEGLIRFDGKMFFRFTSSDGLAGDNVMSLCEDKNSNFWVGTYDGVSRFDGKVFTSFSVKEGLAGEQVRSILQDHHGTIWLGTLKGLSRYNGSVFANYNIESGLPGNMIWCMTESRDGNIWIGTDAGVCEFDGEKLVLYDESSGLINNIVWSVMQDSQGNMWFGTEGGVSKFDGNNFTNYTVRQGLINNFVTAIEQDRYGKIWFGTYGGLSRFDGQRFVSFTEKSGLINNNILSITEDRDGILWFGTEGGISRYDGKSFLNLTEKDGLSNHYVYSSMQDRKGNLWFGTRFGLCKLPAAKNRELSLLLKGGSFGAKSTFERPAGSDIFFKSYGFYDGFSGIGVNGGKTMMEASDGTIWIGANDKLIAYHPEGDPVDFIPPKIQLNAIHLYTEPINWSALSASGKSSIKTNTGAGAIDTEKAADTLLTLGNGVGLSEFYFDGIAPWTGVPLNLNLAYNNNYLTFQYAGITQYRSKKVRYQYKLEGIDKNWSIPSYSAEASFGNIPPGEYVLLLQAISSAGISSGVYRYSFTIRPPWWQTTWAYSLYLLGFTFSMISFIRFRTANLRMRQKQLEAKIEDATRVIRKQKDEVEQQRDQINEARKRSDELLENILPAEIAAELKAQGVVKPVYREGVSVLFTDFVGFTGLAEKMSPENLVSLINRYFTGFDEIVSRFGVEKIKTIGDSYMLVAGVPNAVEHHAVLAAETGLAMLNFVRNLNQELKDSGFPQLELRMGIHSGPAVAGIVGLKKFQYDIWGDTVNTASRMESYGEAGRINISEQTFDLLKHQIPCEYRGEMDVKGKGKVKMYFIRSPKLY
jgi:ligand-binding sensor domain-containing protein/class 3 adenylate cyclase